MLSSVTLSLSLSSIGLKKKIFNHFFPWNLYKMVFPNTCKGIQSFWIHFKFVSAVDLNKLPVLLYTSAPIFELPSNISTMLFFSLHLDQYVGIQSVTDVLFTNRLFLPDRQDRISVLFILQGIRQDVFSIFNIVNY